VAWAQRGVLHRTLFFSSEGMIIPKAMVSFRNHLNSSAGQQFLFIIRRGEAGSNSPFASFPTTKPCHR
jgi:hypothetical protein